MHTYVVHIHIFVRNVILLTAIHFFSLYYILILSIHSIPISYRCFLEELLCLILSSKFHAVTGISKCRAHASLSFGRTYVHNFLYVYLHWSPNPKCCLVPVKPSGPHIFKASTRTRLLRRGPARRSTPTNPTAALIIGFLQEDEGEADL